jgi:CPA1 family monovalent cation:H+ antiporter
VVNSLVFLLIGLEVQLPSLVSGAGAIAWAALAMLAARAVSVYGLLPLTNRFTAPIPFKWRHVLFWGGLRGSLSIALVLSLPTALPGREQLVVMIFGTVILSLLAQGLTISPLLKQLRLVQSDPGLGEHERLQGQLLAGAAAVAELDNLRNRGAVVEPLYQKLRAELAAAQEDLGARMASLDVDGRALERQRRRLQRHLLNEKKARLAILLREGLLSEEAYQELNLKLDKDLAGLQEEDVTN